MKKLIDKIKDILSIFSSSRGFTLLELLIVVLIIGILAAIALPQYRMAVAKTKFATVKNMTKTVGEAIQRYYLVNNVTPKTLIDLDIDFPGYKVGYTDAGEYNFSTPEGITCTIFFNGLNSCGRKIFGKKVFYYIRTATNKPYACLAYSKDTSDIRNRLCQQETNRKVGDCSASSYCGYSY